MFKPFGEKCNVIFKKNYIKEKGKVVKGEDGKPLYSLDQFGTVSISNIEGIKKGTIVIPAMRGGMPIYCEETKTSVTTTFEKEDIYDVK